MSATGEHEGRVALITGGASGIGRAAAELLAERGAAVAVVGVDDAAHEAAAHIRATGGRALGLVADVTDAVAVGRAVTATVAEFGGLDALVTSAGIQRYGSVVETDEAEWDTVFAVNVKGAYLAARAALPHLRQSPAGSVVTVSSVQAHVAQTRVAAYAASKAALLGLMHSIAIDEAAHGVRANAVCPGSVDTPMLRASAALVRPDGGTVDDVVADWGRAHPLGRVALPREVAEVIAFLAGPRSAFMTGEDVRVDGGLLAAIPVALPPAAP